MKKTSIKDSASTAPIPKSDDALSQEEIAQKAYELWLHDGCPVGRSVYHWHEAERQLRRLKQNPESNAKSAPREPDENSLASLTDDASPYSGLEKEVPASTKDTRNFAKRR